MTFAKLTFTAFALLLASRGALAFDGRDPIPGFENPALLQRVLKGEIVAEEKKASGKEFQTIFRAFFKGASPEAYRDIATNHARYPSMFSEVKSAETTKQNNERTEFEYKMDIVFKVGIFQQHVYPEGRQVFTPGKDAVSEASLVHTILNYKEYVETAAETTRLIPYEGGILVYDDVHFTLTKENSQTTLIKNKLKEQFLRFLTTFRKQLGAHPLSY